MKTIADVMICPKCGSDNTDEYNVDEIEFCANGTGHYYSYCSCKNCMHDFKLYMNFEYKVTDSHIR